MNLRFIFLFLLCLNSLFLTHAQDIQQARKWIDTLASPAMFGRGYVNGGDRIAASYIANEFERFGLKPLFSEKRFTQAFTHDVNTFGAEQFLRIGKTDLIPGKDYIIQPFSGSVKGKFKAELVRAGNDGKWKTKKYKSNTAIILYASTPEEYKTLSAELKDAIRLTNLILLINPGKLTWSVADYQIPGKAIIEVKQSAVANVSDLKSVSVDCSAEFKKSYESLNVAAKLEGEIKDTFLIISAHYDHLGKMGPALFAGASDNASGTALMLDLAAYYAKTKKPKYSIIFIAFAAEEAGLVGSKYFVDNPPINLKRIRFVFNIDLMGGGSIGATVVNGSVFENEFLRLQELNTQHNLLGRVNKRGKAANSDHYWFSENGVPSFFMYAEGGVTAYHDVDDTRENLPLTKYNELYTLIRLFLDGF